MQAASLPDSDDESSAISYKSSPRLKKAAKRASPEVESEATGYEAEVLQSPKKAKKTTTSRPVRRCCITFRTLSDR